MRQTLTNLIIRTSRLLILAKDLSANWLMDLD